MTLDVILATILAGFALRGLWRGFVLETMGLAAVVAAGAVAAIEAGPMADVLVARGALRPEIAPALAGGALFVGTYGVVNLLGRVLDRLARAVFLAPLLTVAGMVFAALKTGLLLGLALIAGHRAAPSLVPESALASSRLARPLMAIATVVLDYGGAWLAPRGAGAGGTAV